MTSQTLSRECLICLTLEEHGWLLSMVKEALGDKRVEVRRTHSPAYREHRLE